MQVENDPLQRVYGVSFPSKDRMKKYLEFQQNAKERDHRRLGMQQELFFFHPLSPGSAFFLPHGTRIYNRLMEFIRKVFALYYAMLGMTPAVCRELQGNATIKLVVGGFACALCAWSCYCVERSGCSHGVLSRHVL